MVADLFYVPVEQSCEALDLIRLIRIEASYKSDLTALAVLRAVRSGDALLQSKY
jgi:hypothetical protein